MHGKLETFFFSQVWGHEKKAVKDIPGVTMDEDGNIIAYSIEEQCHSVFQNIRFILEASGSS